MLRDRGGTEQALTLALLALPAVLSAVALHHPASGAAVLSAVPAEIVMPALQAAEHAEPAVLPGPALHAESAVPAAVEICVAVRPASRLPAEPAEPAVPAVASVPSEDRQLPQLVLKMHWGPLTAVCLAPRLMLPVLLLLLQHLAEHLWQARELVQAGSCSSIQFSDKLSRTGIHIFTNMKTILPGMASMPMGKAAVQDSGS